jgi:hypothetical protein
MRLVHFPLALAVSAAIAGVGAPGAASAMAVRAPVDDVGFPFWCDWSYDWEARCYRATGPRLPVGGVDDKVWRAGLRFSLAGIPADATVGSARLELSFDGVCIAPQLTSKPCSAGGFLLEAYPIAVPDWYHEREPDYYWVVQDGVYLDASAGPARVAWDVTDLVRRWLAGTIENNGVLLKLAVGSEDYDVGGPYLPSAAATDAAMRPRLVVTYSSPNGLAR